MAIKKSELYSSLWKSCDELRGGMDASQYKDYVLVLLFVKYVSDKYAGVADALIEVPEGGSFQDIVALKGQKDIGDGINKIITKLAEANDLKGVIDVADFNDADKLGRGKEMQDRLSNLVAIFENRALNFSKNRADGDDILGDAYEYLMRNFATQSGKSKGQFYTPAEVSRVISKVISVNLAQSQDQTIYDPTCGSGSLLLKAADEAERGLTIYGQEMDNATRALARMNMILHGHDTAEIWQDNTLSSPHFKNSDGSLKIFDFAVANPPFSSKAWSNGLNPTNDEFKRFDGYGIPPAKNGDYAFLLHMVRCLKSNGKGAIILPHGVLFRGNAEAEIRKNLICNGIIKGIIGLPANLFFGTGIPACIIVLDKENAENRQGIFMIDASKGFVKDGNKNRLREQDIHKIVDVFNKQLEVPKYSRMVPVKEIEANEYNLNIPRYIDSQEEEDIQDIEAHLLGGIPKRDVEALSDYWQVYPTLQQELFQVADRPGYLLLKISGSEVKACIFAHPEFISYGEEIQAVFETWQTKHTPLLKGIQPGDKPKEIIHMLSENLLQAFAGKSLIDKYDVYQHLMTYWVESMKDDVYILVEDGWKAELTAVMNKKGAVIDYVCELIPKELMINRYFKAEQAAIATLETKKDEIVRQQEELQEEHGGEEGLLEEVTNDSGKITKTNVNDRIKTIKNDATFADELKVLKAYLKLIEQEAEISKQIKVLTQFLDNYVLTKYGDLTEDEIKTLVVDDKWMPTLRQAIASEMERISQRLTQRIQELAERYDTPLPELTRRVEELTAKVEAHLQRMGLVW
ncbi:type I restriction-modification system subunit M [Hassallia byssoidea VB512170]|uniref:site-specific DNA-methyltransferase (adenine-specific) n=1 Tax=Hassallia byssoidea VB512170 TaxID=1304833 RepID=A0A846HIM5_9CYAN|nr:type I restriction-modification system subunit M [Hassalia byssoidea]NEU76480.1 type I restriction-modification system subunit M [Hassalia byssoidea VB512170]